MPSSSIPLLGTSPLLVHRREARSGCARSNPVSITATTTGGAPEPEAPAARARACARARN